MLPECDGCRKDALDYRDLADVSLLVSGSGISLSGEASAIFHRCILLNNDVFVIVLRITHDWTHKAHVITNKSRDMD